MIDFLLVVLETDEGDLQKTWPRLEINVKIIVEEKHIVLQEVPKNSRNDV